jgi:hypothetical protein
LIAKTQLKAAEKETNENTKLKSLNTADLIDFLSCFNKKSCLPAYRQVPVSLHKALIISLGLPAGSTFEANFGDDLGEDVPFIKAIKKLASGRPDTKPKQVLKRHCMVDKSDLDRTALMNMLAICQEVVNTHTAMFEDYSLEEWKEVVVSNIRPLSFRQLIEEYESRYMSPSFTFVNLVNLIVKEFDEEACAINRIKARGVESLAHSAIVPAEQSKSEAAATAEAERKAKVTCYNCGKLGHPAQDCRVNCKFHKKQCANKMTCYIANKKEKRDLKANAATEGEVVSDLSQFVCSRAHNNFTVSSPRMIEVEEKIGIIDTGCNVLCLPDDSSFDVLVKSSSNSKIKIADGKPISIKGPELLNKYVGESEKAVR